MNPFYITEKIGNTRYKTPDGFLLCKDVPIARSGELIYAEHEVPPLIGVNGKVILDREEAELFKPETIASFESKPILDGFHRMVTPENYRDLTIGTINNVRPGTEGQLGFLIADLLIMDDDAIKRVENDIIREVSIGFNADYEQTEKGRGRQLNIKGNHIAIVEEGRAGATCAIGDSKEGVKEMMDPKAMMAAGANADMENSPDDRLTLSLLERLLTMFGVKLPNSATPAAAPAPLAGADAVEVDPGGSVEARLERIEKSLSKLLPVEEEEHGENFDSAGMDARLKALESKMTDPATKTETPKEATEGEGKVVTGDTTEPGDEGADLIGDENLVPAEIADSAEALAPDEKIPEGDSVDILRSVMVNSLMAGSKTHDAVSGMVKSVIGKDKPVTELAKLKTPVLSTLFKSAAALVKDHNNAMTANGLLRLNFGDTAAGKEKVKLPMSGRDLQEIADRAYGKTK